MTIENNAEKRNISDKGRKSAQQKQKNLIVKIIAAAVVAAVVIFAGIKLLSGNAGSTAAYSKPDKAIEAFANKMASGDFEGVLGTFDSVERAQSLDLEKYIERMQVLVPSSMPASKEYQALNEAGFKGEAVTQIKFFAYSIQKNEEVRKSVQEGNVSVSEELPAKDIVKGLNPDNLKGLKVVRCDVADAATQKTDQYKSNMNDLSAIYGCKTIKEYTALFQLGDKYYQGFFTLAQYDKGWKIQSLKTTLLENETGTGAAVEITENEYKQQLKDKK